MDQPVPADDLAADLEALCEKHNLEAGMIAVTQENHFMIMTCNMPPKTMRLLGNVLLQSIPPSDVVLN